MNLYVFSDSHRKTPAMLALISPPPDAVIHCGDGCEDLYNVESDIPVYAVRGNCDSSRRPEELFLTFCGLRIAVTHGHLFGVKSSLTPLALHYKDRADLVLFGHTHTPFDGVVEGVRLFNPGAACREPLSWGELVIEQDGVALLTHREG